ncbi:hypothetical protein B0H11DRAFT_1954177 [Mycena galericulata]|nr:hypothetical protein B0H11DRAFT_1954177 [Mycena galericulata]
MDSGLTAQQVQLHRENLASTTDFRIFPILAETALYAIFTALIVTSSYILITRGLESRTRKMMLAVTLVMYGLSTWDWAIDILLLRDQLKVFLMADLIQPPPDHSKRLQVNAALHVSQAITNNICVMLSDAVVCWRVYVVYGRSKRVLAVASSLLVALFLGLLLCNLTQIGLAFPNVVKLHLLAPTELGVDVVALFFSALVNIWATGMISYKAWRCRREISNHLRDTSKRSFAESILTLFAETGVVYTVLWILKNIILVPNIEPTAYTDYASVIMYQVTGMYPTIIIILVALKRSHLENQFTTFGGVVNRQSIQLGPDIVFASGPTLSGWSPPRFTSSTSQLDIIGSSKDSKTEIDSRDGEKHDA